MRIVIGASRPLAIALVLLFMIPSLAFLFFPKGGWLFIISLAVGFTLGFEIAKVHALGQAKSSLVCLIPPENSDDTWSLVFRAGFVQKSKNVQITPFLGCLWLKAEGNSCLISPDRVSPESWSALQWLGKQRDEVPYLLPPLKDEENLP